MARKMASNTDIIRENDTNVKEIHEQARGKLSLRRGIINFIAEHDAEEEKRRKSQAAGAPALSRAEYLAQKRSEAEWKKRKKQDEGENCPLDADGVHQPVAIFQWEDAPGPIKEGRQIWSRMYCSLAIWTDTHYLELFAYLEPSLLGGARKPTDSLRVLQQLMERIFGYNAGVEKGHTAKKHKNTCMRVSVGEGSGVT